VLTTAVRFRLLALTPPPKKNPQEGKSKVELAVYGLSKRCYNRFSRASLKLRLELLPAVNKKLEEGNTHGVALANWEKKGLAIYEVYKDHPILGDKTLAK
jgi:hypothetical protein